MEKPDKKTRFRTYFEYKVRSEGFLKTVQKIRKQFNIPINGLPFDEKIATRRFRFPEELKLSLKKQKQFLDLMTYLAEEHHMDVVSNFKNLLAYVVIYDMIVLPDYYDFCAIQDVKNPNYSKNLYGETLYSDDTHPISIRISPYVSQTELIAYIKKNFKEKIQVLQILHGSSITRKDRVRRQRKDKSLMISDFIWEHEGVSTSKMIKLLAKESGVVMDSGEIEKIKSLEKTRRK
jgi:hypothetical protein